MPKLPGESGGPTLSQSKRTAWRTFLLASLGFAVLSITYTWPLVLHMGDAVVGMHGDNMHFAWMVGWFEEALLERGQLPYQVPILNYPEGWNLARSEIPTTLILMGLPASVLGEPVLGYNVAVLLSFLLSGLAAFVWIHRLTRNPWAAFFGGAAFALLPYRIAHFRVGHLNILATMWLPLLYMGLFEVLRRPSASYGWSALAALSLGLLSHSSQYLTYVTLLVTAALLASYVLLFDRPLLRQRRWWQHLAVLAGLGVPLVLSGAWPYLQLTAQGSLPQRSAFAVMSGSASLTDFFLPATDHFLWGAWVTENFSRDHWVEGTLYLGAVTGLLAAWVGLRRKEFSEHRKTISLLLLLGLFAVAISLGTHVHWNESQVRIALPDPLPSRLGQDDVSIRLPAFYLYDVLPYFDRLRTFKRTAVLLLLAICVLAALGLDRLQRRWNTRWVPFIALALMLFDFYPGPFEQFAPVEPRPVDHWLAEQAGDGAVAEFPFRLQTEQLHVYYTLEHGKPYLGGFFNAFPPPQYRRIRPVMAEFPSERSVELLGELGVEYVLVSGETYEASHDRIVRTMAHSGYEKGPIFGGIVTFHDSSAGPE